MKAQHYFTLAEGRNKLIEFPSMNITEAIFAEYKISNGPYGAKWERDTYCSAPVALAAIHLDLHVLCHPSRLQKHSLQRQSTQVVRGESRQVQDRAITFERARLVPVS